MRFVVCLLVAATLMISGQAVAQADPSPSDPPIGSEGEDRTAEPADDASGQQEPDCE